MTDIKGLASAFSQTKGDPNANEDDPSQVAQKQALRLCFTPNIASYMLDDEKVS